MMKIRNNKLFLFIVILFGLILLSKPSLTWAATDEWPSSFHDYSKTSTSQDTTLSVTNASQLQQNWSFKTNGPLSAQPAVVNNIVYEGSWDGNMYALNATTGALIWKTYLGFTIGNSYCNPPELGVASSATVQDGVVYVGGGDDRWYALNAQNGTILWSVSTGDNSAPGGHFNWSSPVIINGYAYVGIASLGDCPLVQGLLLKVDLTHHLVVGETKMVPDGEIGGGIWSSPSYDPVLNKIYVATGTENSVLQKYAQALVAINPDSMQIVDYWKLPENQAVSDSDFGTSADLFTDVNGRQLVAAINKNGVAYVFDRTNLAKGPVWQQKIALGGDCPTCGEASVSTGTFQNNIAYFAGETGELNGYNYLGTIRAFDAATGAKIWEDGTYGPIFPALTSDNGLVIDAAGNWLEVRNAANGQRLFSYDTSSGIYSPISIANGSLFFGNLSGRMYSIGLPTSTTTPPADPSCPAGYTCQDIGNPTPAGSETETSGTWNIQTGGAGDTGTSDSFRLMSQNITGDTQLTAQILSSSSVQNGLMFRQTNSPQSPYYEASVSTDNKLTVHYRSAFSGQTVTLTTLATQKIPLYISIQRTGDTFQAATSTDGVNFTLVPGSTITLSLPAQLLSGLSIASGTNGTAGTATIANVSISQPSQYVLTHTQDPCPTNWQCQDIGNPALVGDQTQTNQTYSISAGGNDIWNNDDQFHYLWQSVSTDASVSTRVVSQTSSSPWAKAGVMFRSSTDPAAAEYSVFLTPSNGVLVQYRYVTGSTTSEIVSAAGTAPQYVQIARSGDTFTAYTSTDGNTWTPIAGSTTEVPALSGTIFAGLAATSHNGAVAGTSVFDSVNVTNSAPLPPGACPDSWTCEDIGNPFPLGEQSVQNNTWTINGGGSDIWGTNDIFRYDFQQVSGDGTFSTKIVSQTNTSAWAKSGIMERLSDDAASPYYAILTTPANGTFIQYRLTQGGNTSQIAVSATGSPAYVQIIRSGTTFRAATSSDGTTWTPVANTTISFPTVSETILAGMAVTSHNSDTLSQVVFTNPQINQTVSTACPTYWTCTDIGAPTLQGSSNYSQGIYTLNGSGNDIWGTNDQFQYVYQNLTGDGNITAKVLSQTHTDSWAKAGVMIKESAATGTKYVLLGVTPDNGIVTQSNFNQSQQGGTYTFPVFVQVKRTGNVFTALTSTDGNNWTQVGQYTVPMNTNATAGLFVTAHNGNALGTATFSNVTITTGNDVVPQPWNDTDVGNPSIAGFASYTKGTFSVNGSGSDIHGTDDQFNYINQPLNGDGTIIARITSQSNTDPWAKAGIMIKQNTTAGSPYVLQAVTPGHGVNMEFNYTANVAGSTYAFPNAWVKLTRSGNTFTAYQSPDGLNWSITGSTTVAMNTNATVGLFTTSHTNSTLGTATFDNVTVTQDNALPAGWTNTDIGSPVLGGSSGYVNGVFTINGAGSDIWQNTDQMQYASQPISGDATITAHMLTQTNTDPWAKAGIMIKESAKAMAPYVWFGETPTNGLHLQSNFTTDLSAGSYFNPQWIRLKRAGNIFTSYTSDDGTNWIQQNQFTASMSATATIGLFVTSHNTYTQGSATFDNVTITQP